MKFKAPDRIGSVSLSSGTHRVVNGLVDIPEVSEADEDALRAFGFERFTAVEEGSFRGRDAEHRPEGPRRAAGDDEPGEPGPDPAVAADDPADAGADEPQADPPVAPRFKTKWEAEAFARETLGVEFDGRRSLRWMNEEIARRVAAPKANRE